MLTYQELLTLRAQLEAGEIELTVAQAAYWKDVGKGKKSWQTKDWKERRDTMIKDACEICGGQDTLTLQHRWHPQKHAQLLTEITSAYTKTFLETAPPILPDDLLRYVIEKYEYVPIPWCPQCKRSRPNQRMRKSPVYLCTGCRHEFDSPDYYSVESLVAIFYEQEDALEVRDKCFVSRDEWRNKNNLASIRYWMQRDRARQQGAEAIAREAFLRHLDENIRYLSFVDTYTACGRCAYHYDIHAMDLCPKCRRFYKGIQYPTCIPCLPEDRRKAVLETIALANDWQNLEKRMGID